MLLCLLLCLHHSAFAATSTPVILVLGDSLSGAWGIDRQQGWVALMQKQLQQQAYPHKMVNASVSGDTTRTGLSRLDAALKQHQPAIVIVALGGNDGLRGLPFSEVQGSLAKIIERCHKQNAKVVLVGVRLPSNYGPAYNKKFAEIYQQLAKHYKIPLVPRMLDQVGEHRELMQEDGIHPTARAQPQIMHNIWEGLRVVLENK